MTHSGNIVVLDFGGQYAHLITNRIRRLGVYSELVSHDTPINELKSAAGIILSGGGDSVNDFNSPKLNPEILNLGIPILGICYGLQSIVHSLGGKVESHDYKEYGNTKVHFDTNCKLFSEIPKISICWMSHGDSVTKLPDGFQITAKTDHCPCAAIANEHKKIYGIQFHPEVTHTLYGTTLLNNFIQQCQIKPYNLGNKVEQIIQEIRTQVGTRKVFIFVSGGVDSSVTYALLNRALPKSQVYGVMIDTGLMRKDEAKKIKLMFDTTGLDLHVENASQYFMSKLKDIYDPETKRKIIGEAFLDIKDQIAERMNMTNFLLAQGTIYPDTIESGGTKNAKVIKTHHNRIDKINELIAQGLIIEPLKELYKDEVREVGTILGLPEYLIHRHPFPGPGLGIRLLCCDKYEQIPNETEILEKAYQLTAECDMINQIALLPIKSVGVQGDARSYQHALVFFISNLSYYSSETLWNYAKLLPNKIQGINRILMCLSHINNHRNNKLVCKEKCSITNERADLLREVDDQVNHMLTKHNLYHQIWQFPVVLLPIKEPNSDQSRESVVLRPVNSVDAMSAEAQFIAPNAVNEMIKVIKDVQRIDFVFFDLTSKPPSTIEYE